MSKEPVTTSLLNTVDFETDRSAACGNEEADTIDIALRSPSDTCPRHVNFVLLVLKTSRSVTSGAFASCSFSLVVSKRVCNRRMGLM